MLKIITKRGAKRRQREGNYQNGEVAVLGASDGELLAFEGLGCGLRLLFRLFIFIVVINILIRRNIDARGRDAEGIEL